MVKAELERLPQIRPHRDEPRSPHEVLEEHHDRERESRGHPVRAVREEGEGDLRQRWCVSD